MGEREPLPPPGRLHRLFVEVMALPADERLDAVVRLCGDDEVLRARLTRMVSTSDATPQILEKVGDVVRSQTLRNAVVETVGDRFDDFELLDKLGAGTFGTVWRAHDERLGRVVALKILNDGVHGERGLKRFENEGRALARMDHPHIARIHGAGITPGGRPYLVMEFVDGARIDAYSRAHALSLDERFTLMEQVCRTVDHAHAHGFIHRDLKPDNVLVETRDGRPWARVIDFGIAKVVDHGAASGTLTRGETLLGTLGYMSPEQLGAPGDVDARSDVYALGAILYELVSGRPLIPPKLLGDGTPMQQAARVRAYEPGPPSRSRIRYRTTDRSESRQPPLRARRAEDLDRVIATALARDPADRYASAADLADDLHRLSSGNRVRATQGFRRRRFGGTERWAVAAALVLLAAGAALGGGILDGALRNGGDDAAPTEADADRTAAIPMPARSDPPAPAPAPAPTVSDAAAATVAGPLAAPDPAPTPESPSALMMVLTGGDWHYLDSLHPPGDQVRFRATGPRAGTFHDRWKWTFVIVDEQAIAVDVWDDGTASDALLRFDAERNHASGQFVDPEGRSHELTLVRIPEPDVEPGVVHASFAPGPEAGEDRTIEPHLEIDGHTGRVSALAFDTTETRLFSGGNSTTRTRSGRRFLNHPGDDNTVRTWSLHTGSQLQLIRHGLGQRYTWQVQGIEVFDQGRLLAVTTARPSADWCYATLTVWSTTHLGQRAHVPLGGRPGAWKPMALGDDRLAVVRADGDLHVLDATDGFRSFETRHLLPKAGEIFVLCAAAAPDANLLFLGCRNGSIHTFRTDDFGRVAGPDAVGPAVRQLALAHGGSRLLAVAGATVTLWDTATHRAVGRLSTDEVHAAAFVGCSADRVVVATGSETAVWRFGDGQPERLATLAVPDPTGRATSLCTSKSGSLVARGDADGGILVWRLGVQR